MRKFNSRPSRLIPAFALGGLLLSGCASAEPVANCFSITIEDTDQTVINAVHRELSEQFPDNDKLEGIAETIYDAHGALIDSHEKYKSIIPDDSFEACAKDGKLSFVEVIYVNER